MDSWSPIAEPTPPASHSDDDWTGVTDLAARRKLQNRKSQRKHREKIRRHITQLEARLAFSTPDDYAWNTDHNHSRQQSTPGPIPSGLDPPDCGATSPYDSTSITGTPDVNDSPVGQYNILSSPNEFPNRSPYYPAQNHVLSGMYFPSASMKGSVNPQPVCAMPHVSQAPYQNIDHHQILPQSPPLHEKYLDISPHQGAGGQGSATSQHSPFPVNMMYQASVPQTTWPDTSGYIGLPVSQINYPHCVNTSTNADFSTPVQWSQHGPPETLCANCARQNVSDSNRGNIRYITIPVDMSQIIPNANTNS